MHSAEPLNCSAALVIPSTLSEVLPVTLLVGMSVLMEVLLSVTPEVALSVSLAMLVGKLNTKGPPLSEESHIAVLSQWNLLAAETSDAAHDDDKDVLLLR